MDDDEKRAAIRKYVNELITPKPLRYTLTALYTATMGIGVAGMVAPRPWTSPALRVAAVLSALVSIYWLVRMQLVARRFDRK